MKKRISFFCRITLLTALLCAGTGLFAETPAEQDRLKKAAEFQQGSISELLQTRKNIQKVLLNGDSGAGSGKMNGAKNQDRSPFKDKQEMKSPPGQNPEDHLKQLIEKQKKLNEAMKSEKSDSSELAEKQKKQTGELNQLQGKIPQDEIKNELKDAGLDLEDAQNMLESGKKEMAAINGQKAEIKLRQALRKFQKVNEEKMKEALREAQSKLEDSKSAQKGKDGDKGQQENGQKQGDKEQQGGQNRERTDTGKSGAHGGMNETEYREMLKDLADQLKEQARDQLENGRRDYGEVLTALAKEAEKAAKAGAPEKAAESLLRELKEQRLKEKTARQLLNEGSEALRELLPQLKFLSRHPEEFSAQEAKKLKKEIQSQLMDVRLALEEIREKGTLKGGDASGAARLLDQIQNAQDQLSKLPEEYSSAAARADYLKLSGEIAGILTETERLLNRLQSGKTVYSFNPDDVPEQYRKDVEDYFKRLSEKENGAGQDE